jgi:xanthine dehydrogenase accessory factor
VKDIYAEIVRSLEEKEKLALATIINRVGSAPREAGAKYLVKKDGTSVGSIGGGCVEAEVWQEAQKAIERGERKVLHFNLTSEQLAEGGLICGGNIDVFVEPLKEDFLKIYREVLKVREDGSEGILASIISTDGTSLPGQDLKAFYRRSGEKIGSLLGSQKLDERIVKEMERLLRMKSLDVMILSSSETTHPWTGIEILLEPVFSEPTVYIFGAGHISQQLAPLIQKVHFKVVVIDDREMFANKELFPDADEVIVTELEKAFEHLTIDQSSYIIIVTRGHLYDGLILAEAVKTKAHYIGMIGSKKKIQTLYKNLAKEGIPESLLKRVHAPIGLDIGSETPEEIAVSIVAQLIQEKRKKLA